MIEIDPVTGIKETYKKDHETGKIHVTKSADLGKILELNQAEANEHINNNWKGDMHKVASIPLLIIDMWREELKAKGANNCCPLAKENRNFLIAKINSGDWSKLRTKQGHI